jgi:hypothetical protein
MLSILSITWREFLFPYFITYHLQETPIIAILLQSKTQQYQPPNYKYINIRQHVSATVGHHQGVTRS